MSILRDYQQQAVRAFWDALSPDVNRVMVAMATGLGKTITSAGAISEFLLQHGPSESGGKALVLVETDELVQSWLEKLAAVTRGRWSIGVVKAGRNEVDADIVVASVATLRNPERMAQLQDVGFIVVDECHHAIAQSYRDILVWFGAIPVTHGIRSGTPVPPPAHPPIPVLGVTATPSRSDGQGLGHIWQDLAFSRDLLWGIRKGFLVDAIPYTIKAGDGTLAEASNEALDSAYAEGFAPEAVVQAWMDRATVLGPRGLKGMSTGDPLPSTVLFAPLVRSATLFAEAFQVAGIKAEVVHGAMPDAERRAVLERYEAGTTTVLCNAMVLTEGWDSPRTKCVIVARPTKSAPLFIQMIGRGLRPWLAPEAPKREDQRCVLLVVTGTSETIEVPADLSDKLGEVQEGKSLLAMADEWDIGAGIEDAPEFYAGPIRVEQWDTLVQRSSKAWKYTEGGVPFLPTAKRNAGYVFLVEREGTWTVWAREKQPLGGHTGAYKTSGVVKAPDLELAMALAEDEAQARGGDLGAMLADKSRPWRKAVPSAEMLDQARRLNVNEAVLRKILASKSAGKAGRVSDLIDQRAATIVLDPVVRRIKERGART